MSLEGENGLKEGGNFDGFVRILLQQSGLGQPTLAHTHTQIFNSDNNRNRV